VSSDGEKVEVKRMAGLPPGLDDLVRAASGEGFGALQRLRDEWDSGANRFDRPGEVLLEARVGALLAGVCGLNRDPHAGSPDIGRVRRLYVEPAFRRRGVGRLLVAEIIRFAPPLFSRLRLRTRRDDADRFYLALGFRPVVGDPDATHELALG
jgi:GNAT superfamily N-acetyltransferase